jgi:hypothetical protein
LVENVQWVLALDEQVGEDRNPCGVVAGEARLSSGLFLGLPISTRVPPSSKDEFGGAEKAEQRD